MLDPTIFSRIKTKQDFDRERAEFDARKRQQAMQEQLGGLQVLQAQKQLSQPDALGTEQLIAKSIELGGFQNLSPQEQAQLQAADIAQRTKQSVDRGGNVITNRSYFDLLGQSPSRINTMPPEQVFNAPIGSTSVPPAILPQGINGGGSNAPESFIPVQMNQQDIENAIDYSDPVLANQQAAAGRARELNQPYRPSAPITVNPADFGVTSPYGQEDVNKKAAEISMGEQVRLREEQRVYEREQAKKTADNKQVFNTFNTALDNVSSQMQKATTNPLIGSLPALTPEQQGAQGAVSVMAPILKQLFRTAGEGTFTDKDQELLINMLPSRSDYPSVRDQKINAIKAIVSSKLNITAPETNYKNKYGLE